MNIYSNFEAFKLFVGNTSYEEKMLLSASLYTNVIRHGTLEMLQYLHDKRFPWQSSYVDIIAIRGDLEMLKYAIFRMNANIVQATYITAYKGHTECFFYLQGLYEVLNEKLFKDAIKGGNKDIIEYLYNKKCPMSAEAMDEAINQNNLEMVKWLHSIGCPTDKFVLNSVCYSYSESRIEIFTFLHKSGCKLYPDVLHVCIDVNNYECFKYALENGCPFSHNLYKEIKERDRRGMMKLLHDHFYEDYHKAKGDMKNRYPYKRYWECKRGNCKFCNESKKSIILELMYSQGSMLDWLSECSIVKIVK